MKMGSKGNEKENYYFRSSLANVFKLGTKWKERDGYS